jgi:hypothetical protein
MGGAKELTPEIATGIASRVAEETPRIRADIAALSETIHAEATRQGYDLKDVFNLGNLTNAILVAWDKPKPRADGPQFIPATKGKSRPPKWLWRGRLVRRHITTCDGDSEAGKSTMLYDLIARVTRGLPMPGDSAAALPSPAGALIVTEDPPEEMIIPRLEAAGADKARIFFPDETTPAIRLPRDTELLRAQALDVDARIIVFDPFVDYLDGRVRVTDNQDVAPLMANLRLLSQACDAAVVLVRHFTKQQNSSLHRGQGATRVASSARVKLVVVQDPLAPDDPDARILGARTNLGRRPKSVRFRFVDSGIPDFCRVEWGDSTDHSADDLVSPSGGTRGPPPEARVAAKDFLLATLPVVESFSDICSVGVDSTDLFEQAEKQGISRSSIFRAKKEMDGIVVCKPGSDNGKTFFWARRKGNRDQESDRCV